MLSKKNIREILLNKGYSITSWSKKNGFKPSIVHQVICRYGNSKFKKPTSPLVYSIILKLKKETGIDLRGGK